MNIKKTTKYEFIGSRVEITGSKNKTLIGLKGKIENETKNMFTLDNGKKLIKSESIFNIKIGGKVFKIDGKLLVGRPEDRAKKNLK